MKTKMKLYTTARAFVVDLSLIFPFEMLECLLQHTLLAMEEKMEKKPEEVTASPILIDPRMLNNYYDHDDEINLVDLWLSLLAHKNVFFIIFIFIISLAAIYIAVTPKTYNYKTDIAIGTQTSQTSQTSQTQLIQPPEAIAANLENAIIPKIVMQQHLKHPNNKLDVTVSSPKNTNSVLLTSKGTIDQKEAITKLHQQLINVLAESHRKKAASMLDYLKDELTSSQSMLTKLSAQSKQLSANNDQITLQLINLENTIRETKRNIAQFTETHSAMGTVQSIKPANKSSKLILAVSIVLGLFMGVFAALFTGFLTKVKEQQ